MGSPQTNPRITRIYFGASDASRVAVLLSLHWDLRREGAVETLHKGVRSEWSLDKTQQNKLFFNGFSGSRSVSAG